MRNHRFSIHSIFTLKGTYLSCGLLKVFIMLVLTLSVGSQAVAYISSEESQFAADLNEAIVRARDFKRTIEAQARENKERESYAYQHKQRRAREIKQREESREEFIRWRNSQPDRNRELERLEKQYRQALEREEREMERARARYIAERDRIREVLKREAYINEMVEYGLKSP